MTPYKHTASVHRWARLGVFPCVPQAASSTAPGATALCSQCVGQAESWACFMEGWLHLAEPKVDSRFKVLRSLLALNLLTFCAWVWAVPAALRREALQLSSKNCWKQHWWTSLGYGLQPHSKDRPLWGHYHLLTIRNTGYYLSCCRAFLKQEDLFSRTYFGPFVWLVCFLDCTHPEQCKQTAVLLRPGSILCFPCIQYLCHQINFPEIYQYSNTWNARNIHPKLEQIKRNQKSSLLFPCVV